MALHYKYSQQRESNVMKELNYLDQILYDNQPVCQNYPYLFQNQDSQFVPDAINQEHFTHNNNSNNQIEKYKENEEQEKKVQYKFQQYLDSLDINQFLQTHNQIPKLDKNYTSKSHKHLEGSLQCTFKPSILKKSSQMAINMQPSFERLTMPVRNSSKKLPYKPVNKQIQKQYSKSRMERLSKPRTLRTQPSQITEYKKPDTQKKNVAPRLSNYLDVAARNQLWQEQKQLKIQKLRKQQQQQRLKKQAGTFAPKLTQYRGDKSANLSNFVKQGIASYFERLNMAKSKNYSGKQNDTSHRKQNSSPYGSNSNQNHSKTPPKDSKKQNQKIKYDDAVKELRKKLMNLNI